MPHKEKAAALATRRPESVDRFSWTDRELNSQSTVAKQVEPTPSSAALRAREYRARQKAKREANAAAGIANGVTQAPANVTLPVTTVARTRAVWLGVALTIVATALTGTGMAMTVTYAMDGGDGYERVPLGILAVSADALALLMPSAALALWIGRRRLLAMAAVVLWVTAAGLTMTNLAGFVGANSDHFIAGRETAATQHDVTLERVARLRAERARITETRPVGVIALAVANASRARVGDERAALALAKRRDAVEGELSALAPTLATLPAIGTTDPAASTIAAAIQLLTGVAIAPNMLARLRTVLLLLLPLCAGPIMAVGLGRR